MTLKAVQKQVDDWVMQYKIEYFKPLETLARLTEESGELARELNHRFGPTQANQRFAAPSRALLGLGEKEAF